MRWRAWRGVQVCAVVVVLMTGARSAFGQPAVSISAVTVGATIGRGSTGNQWSGGGKGPWLSANVDLPVLPAWRVRLSAGATHWTPTNKPHEGGEPAGRVSLRHVNVTVLHDYIEPTLQSPFGIYWGFGAGYYRYRIEHGSFKPDARGLHGLAGMEFVNYDRHLAVRVEAQIQYMGGPDHRQVWAYSLPAISFGVGISRRF